MRDPVCLLIVDRSVPEPEPVPEPVPPPVTWPGPLSVSGRKFRTPDGKPYRWLSVTGFRLLELLAHGRAMEAIDFLDWCAAHGVNPRVLTMCRGMFQLTMTEGRAALPQLMELAKARGLYVNVCCWADTKGISRDVLRAHALEVARICAEAGNAIVEGGNEIDPPHETQNSGLADVGFLRELKAAFPAGVLFAYGSTHGSNDESLTLAEGHWHSVHMDRSRDRYNRERRVRELFAVMEAKNIAVNNQEPIRRGAETGADPDPSAAFCQGVLTDLFQVAADTIHYAGGRDARIPQGAELACFEDWKDGHQIIPFDGPGRYYNSNVNGGWDDSPVQSHDLNRCVRAYAWWDGSKGYIVGVGCEGDGGIRLKSGVRIVSEHGRQMVRVLKIAS